MIEYMYHYRDSDVEKVQPIAYKLGDMSKRKLFSSQ